MDQESRKSCGFTAPSHEWVDGSPVILKCRVYKKKVNKSNFGALLYVRSVVVTYSNIPSDSSVLLF